MFKQLNKPKDNEKDSNEFTINLDNVLPNKTNNLLNIVIRFFFVLASFLTITSLIIAISYIIPKSILIGILEDHLNDGGVALINVVSIMVSVVLGAFSGIVLGETLLYGKRVEQYILTGDINA